MRTQNWLATLIGIIGLNLGLFGCSTPKPIVTDEQELIKREVGIGRELATQLEEHVRIVNDAKIHDSLKKMAETLTAQTYLGKIPIKISLIRQKKDKKWRNYSLPGNRIYLAVEILRTMDFENEIAAAVAVEMGHLLKRHVMQKLPENRPEDHLSLSGIFTLTVDEEVEAARNAVGILYRAGYDPRGVVSFYKKLEENSVKVDLEKKLITTLVEESRREIAIYSPLRNPIVGSPSFVELQQRIHRL